jgi:RimJ/RimL family protein N-acetyltransferase
MNNLQILGSHKSYQYVYMDPCDELSAEYIRMYKIIKANGHALASDSWEVDGGILLKNNNEVIAGSFFNFSKRPSSILINVIFVEEQHRHQGIYTKMHSLIDELGKEKGQTSIYSYIHSDNRVMQEHIMKKIGYETVMHIVKRVIK